MTKWLDGLEVACSTLDAKVAGSSLPTDITFLLSEDDHERSYKRMEMKFSAASTALR